MTALNPGRAFIGPVQLKYWVNLPVRKTYKPTLITQLAIGQARSKLQLGVCNLPCDFKKIGI